MVKFFVRGILFISFGLLFSITSERDHNTPQGVILMALAMTWIFEPQAYEAICELDKKYGKPNSVDDNPQKEEKYQQ